MTQTNLIMTLSNNRQIGYAEYGDPNGFAVFFFHGFPGSRLMTGDFDEIARIKHCRLIGIDRPGMGLSSPDQNHTLLSWTDDIKKLANHLNINTFSIIAHSGGAPYALACAHQIPKRVSHIALVSAMPPTTLPETRNGVPRSLLLINMLTRNIPGVSWLLMQLQRKILLKPNMLKKIAQQSPEPDRLILQNPEQIKSLIKASTEAFRQGVDGAACEIRILLKDWKFNIEDIQTPITIWQGRLDKQALVSHAELYKRKLLLSKLYVFDNDAHLSTLYNHIEEIIDSIHPVSTTVSSAL